GNRVRDRCHRPATRLGGRLCRATARGVASPNGRRRRGDRGLPSARRLLPGPVQRQSLLIRAVKDERNMLTSATRPLSRRSFCRAGAFSLTPLALSWLLGRERAAAAPKKPPLQPVEFNLAARPPHFAPQATAMI